jgi:hypothetical protein
MIRRANFSFSESAEGERQGLTSAVWFLHFHLWTIGAGSVFGWGKDFKVIQESNLWDSQARAAVLRCNLNVTRLGARCQ